MTIRSMHADQDYDVEERDDLGEVRSTP